MNFTEANLGSLTEHEWSILREALNLQKANLDKLIAASAGMHLSRTNLDIQRKYRWKQTVTQKLIARLGVEAQERKSEIDKRQ